MLHSFRRKRIKYFGVLVRFTTVGVCSVVFCCRHIYVCMYVYMYIYIYIIHILRLRVYYGLNKVSNVSFSDAITEMP